MTACLHAKFETSYVTINCEFGLTRLPIKFYHPHNIMVLIWTHLTLKAFTEIIKPPCQTIEAMLTNVILLVILHLRHPEGCCRPTFSEVLDSLLQPESELLYWKPISEDGEGVHSESKSAILGAPLQAGEQLYPELQCTYMSMYEAASIPLQ